MEYIPRYLERKFLKMSETFKAVMVTGARQVGKTTMLRHLAQGSGRTYVTMDRQRDRQLAQEDPELFFQIYKPPILIDEAQKAPALFETIKVLCDASDERGMFWLTGSQSKRLVREAGDSLAGRIGMLKMYGLSLNERLGIEPAGQLDFSFAALAARQEHYPANDIATTFDHIWRGGLPDTVHMDEEQAHEYFESYIETYLMRDAVDDNGVSNIEGFGKMLRACAALIGSLLNYSVLAEAAGISVPTAKEWVRILQGMGVLYLLEPYSNNEMKRLVRMPKLYFCDTGLAAHLSMWTSVDTLLQGAASGHYYENFVVMELVKSFAHAQRAAALTFYRDSHQKEVDLFVETGGNVHPFEVKKSAGPSRRDIKKFEVLDKAQAPRGEGGIICMCTEPYPIDAMNSLVPSNIF